MCWPTHCQFSYEINPIHKPHTIRPKRKKKRNAAHGQHQRGATVIVILYIQSNLIKVTSTAKTFLDFNKFYFQFK